MPGKFYSGGVDVQTPAMNAKAYCEGRKANIDGQPNTANPHDQNIDAERYWAWLRGWDHVQNNVTDPYGCAQ